MKLKPTIEQLSEKISKEQLEELYINQRINKELLAKQLNISLASLDSLINYYGLIKKNKLNKLEDLQLIINPEEFKEEFYLNTTQSLAKKYSTTPQILNQHAKGLGLTKTQEDINKYRNNILKESANNSFEEELKIYTKEYLEDLYLIQNLTQDEIANKLNFSVDKLQKFLNYYNIHKDRKEISKKQLQELYNQYGGKDNYHNYMCKKRKETWIKNYGSLEGYKEHRGRKLSKQWNLKTKGEKDKIINQILTNGSTSLTRKDSQPNLKFQKFLKIKFPNYNEDKDREIVLNNKSYDFKINNNLIELNPYATHNSTWGPFGIKKGLDKYYHKEKSQLAQENGYRCIHIWDWDDKEKVINSLLDKEIIHARKCIIKEVNIKQCNEFLDRYHFQNSCRKQEVRLGLYYNNELIQIITFGKPRYNKNYEWELLRLCTKSLYKVVGGAEKLFKYFVNSYKPQSIISYCDLSKFTGDVYTKLGFKLNSISEPNKHWYNPNNKIHITDNLLRQRGFDQLLGNIYGKFGKGTSNEILMLQNKFVEIYDCGQATYIWYNIENI